MVAKGDDLEERPIEFAIRIVNKHILYTLTLMIATVLRFYYTMVRSFFPGQILPIDKLTPKLLR